MQFWDDIFRSIFQIPLRWLEVKQLIFFMLVLFWVWKIQVVMLQLCLNYCFFSTLTQYQCNWQNMACICVERFDLRLVIRFLQAWYNWLFGFDSPFQQLYQFTLGTEGSSHQHNTQFFPTRQELNGSSEAGFFPNHLLKPLFKMKKNWGTYVP